MTTGAYCVGWWLVASALLWLTWNRVIGALFKTKAAQFWQAALLIATICVMCAPRYYMRHGNCGHGGGHGMMGHGMGMSGSSPCPYEKSEAAKPASP